MIRSIARSALEHRSLVTTGLCALFWAAGTLLGTATGLPLFVLAYLVGGYDKAIEGLDALRRGRLDIDLLMILAAIAAAALGHWDDGAMLILIFALSGALEDFALGRTKRSIAALMELRPDQARVRRDGVEETVPVEEVRVGETVLVKTGEKIPLDGTVQAGSADVDQSAITGESRLIPKETGEAVFAGTLNVQGFLEVRVEKDAGNTLFARILDLVEQAQNEAPPTQRFLDRIGPKYAWGVVLSTVGLLFGMRFLLGWGWEEAVYRAITYMVVASPCALMLSSVPTVLSAIANGARHGVLIKGGDALERLAEIDLIAFDKTGTLTSGVLEVVHVIGFGEAPPSEEALLRIAASLEKQSSHPIAEAVVRRADEQGIPLEAPTDVVFTGQGVSGSIEGRRYHVGSLRHFDEVGVPVPTSIREAVQAKQNDGQTVILVSEGDTPVGLVILRDAIRQDASASIGRLKRIGVRKIALLTGDHSRNAYAIAEAAGIDEVFCDLLPDDKLALVREMSAAGRRIAFVGDGVNDAPALAAAHVGIAMGKIGTDAALETADIVLMSDDLSKLPYAVSLSRKSRRVVRQNVTFALGVILALVGLSLFGLIDLPLAVVGHEGSTILVALNGLRLLRALPIGSA